MEKNMRQKSVRNADPNSNRYEGHEQPCRVKTSRAPPPPERKSPDNAMSILYSVCMNEKNIKSIIDTIYEDVKLNEKHRPKCVAMIAQNMKQNIRKLSRSPKNKEELKEIVYYLNKICVDDIIRYIVAKNPGLHINRRKHVGKEQIKRDLDVYGERDCHVQKRPHAKTVKDYEEDADIDAVNMRINDTGFMGADSHSNIYASPWENYSITNEQPKIIDSAPSAPVRKNAPESIPFNNPHTQRNPDEFDQRFQMLMNDRRGDVERPRPPEIDFALDGGNDKTRQERMTRTTDNHQGMMSGTPVGMDGLSAMNDDPYASLLGGGAPLFGDQSANIPNDNQFSNFQGTDNQFNVQNQLMPQSSTCTIQNQHDQYGGGQQNAKTAQLQSEYEKYMAKRREIDIETGQDDGSARQNSMMPQSMMQQPMMQQTMMQQPMMQQPMMQQPMMQQPMMQQPMYQQPMMQQQYTY